MGGCERGKFLIPIKQDNDFVKIMQAGRKYTSTPVSSANSGAVVYQSASANAQSGERKYVTKGYASDAGKALRSQDPKVRSEGAKKMAEYRRKKKAKGAN